MNAEQAKRVRAAIDSWPESLPPVARQQLRDDLDRRYGFGNEPYEVVKDLAARCRAARAGKPLPASTVLTKLKARHSVDNSLLRDKKKFVRMLPELLAAQRRGEPALIPVDPESDATLKSLVAATAAIEDGNARALEYFLRWAVGPSAEKYNREYLDWAVDGGLFALAAHRELPWPADLDLNKANLPILAGCLRYVRDPDTALPESLKKVLAAGPENPFRTLVLEACAARRDRAAAELVAKIIASPTDYPSNALTDYYQLAGITADTSLLRAKARSELQKAKVGEDYRVRDGNILSAETCEEAIRHLQFKKLFSGETLATY